MSQFGLEPKDAFGILKALMASLPLLWQRLLLISGAIGVVVGWFAKSGRALEGGICLVILAFASRVLLRAAVAAIQLPTARLIAEQYASDRVLFSQLYFDARDQLTLFIVEENTLNATKYQTSFRVRLITLGRSAFEIPIRMKDGKVALEEEWHGVEWNPGGFQVYLNELHTHQSQNLWTKVARVYGLPFQEIIGIGIPGGGSGVRSIHLNLLDVRSGSHYQGSITSWRDIGAPLETLIVAPFNQGAASVALKISDRFGMFPTKTRLAEESRSWRVAHGRKGASGRIRLRWFPVGEVFATIGESGLTLGSYKVASIFKGPVVILDGGMAAIIYVPPSPYDFGTLTSNSKGGIDLSAGPSSKIVFSLDGQTVIYQRVSGDGEDDAKRREPSSSD